MSLLKQDEKPKALNWKLATFQDIIFLKTALSKVQWE